MKRLYKTLGLVAGLIVTALFIWYVVRSLRGHDLSVYATPRAAIAIVVAAVFWTIGQPLLAFAWHGMLRGLGVHRTRRELVAIVGLTQLAKYVPGNVAQYIGRVGMSLARGIPARAVAITMVLESLLLVTAAVTVGMGAGALSRVGLAAVKNHGAQLGLIVAVLALAVVGLVVFRRVGPSLLRRFAPKYATVLDGSLMPAQTSIVRAFMLYCLMYVVIGVGLISLIAILQNSPPNDYWLLIAIFALAWLIGFVTPGAPAGLGVREGLMLLMLAPVYSPAASSLFVIALRIATTLGDLLFFGVGWLLLPKSHNPSDIGESTTSPPLRRNESSDPASTPR